MKKPNETDKNKRSTVIEFLESDLPIPGVGLAFVYCNHKKNLVQSIGYFLGVIARQLMELMEAVPNEARALYEKHLGKETNPTCQEYTDLLRSFAKEYSKVYIVIDALDE